MRPFSEWKVLPHGKLKAIEENILTVTGDIHMPLTELPRTMTVVRLHDGRLVIWSAIALDEGEMKQLEEYGRPSFLIVPSANHRIDAKIWKARYPALRVIAPAGAREKVEEVVPVDATGLRIGNGEVRFIAIPGTDGKEAALVVHSSRGTTVVLSDLIANVQGVHGFGGWILRMLGFAGEEPQIPLPASKLIDDPKAVSRQLMIWSRLPSLRRVVVSHGDAIEDRPRDALRNLAASLS